MTESEDPIAKYADGKSQLYKAAVWEVLEYRTCANKGRANYLKILALVLRLSQKKSIKKGAATN